MIGAYVMVGTIVIGLFVLLVHEIWYRKSRARDALALGKKLRAERPPAFTSIKRY